MCFVLYHWALGTEGTTLFYLWEAPAVLQRDFFKPFLNSAVNLSWAALRKGWHRKPAAATVDL